MRVSLNLVKKYVDLPKDLTEKQIAYDLTVRTVEVEDVINTKDKYNNIVVGQIKEIKPHPNADLLKICMVDIGEKDLVQIVCGGSNLYEDEYVVVSKPGAMVVWHGEGEPVEIKETKMRGESSYGMICAAEEVYLSGIIKQKDEKEIVDLKGFECSPGDSIADVLELSDTVLEIDNKSLTNRPDLWGHYGIARELSAIYDAPLKELDDLKIDKSLPSYDVEIKDTKKCNRYTATIIENVYEKESPMWMKSILINTGLRPINAIVDITNYVMIAVGQPSHAFDKTHVEGDKIVVRNAKKGEKLVLLDGKKLDLEEDDLVICDTKEPMGLAGIKGGAKDSILSETTSVLLEMANFTAPTIRKTGKRFDEKTDSSIRYEKNLDTERVSTGLALALELFKEIFPESKVVAFTDNYPVKTEREKISVSQEFLDTRLGKKLDSKSVTKVLANLGYDVDLNDGVYTVVVPVWRSTGDVSIKDDVMGDIARVMSYETIEEAPLKTAFTHAVIQNDVLLERRIKEYLALRCGFNEIYTYPWAHDKYLNAIGVNKNDLIKLATPPAPDMSNLRPSLIPGMLEKISDNLRYYEEFKLFEVAQSFVKGEYHPSTKEEILPVHIKYLTGSITGKDAKKIFFESKGVVEEMSLFTHMEKLSFVQKEKPNWADKDAYLNIVLDKEIVGSLGLLKASSLHEAGIKRTNVCLFEINMDKLIPFASRTNEFKHLPLFPLVEKDLSIIVDEEVNWKDIKDSISSMANEVIFIEEYRGSQIPKDKKSIMLRVKIGNSDSTMTTEQINGKMNAIIKTLNKKCNAVLREE